MPIKTMTPNQQQIDQLRNMFIEKYENNPPEVKFHSVDIDRIRNHDTWCIKFLEMYDLDLNVSFEKLWSTCVWRQQFGANDLNETNVRMDYLTDGVIFPRNKDIDGKPILIFKTKKHVKGSKDMNEIVKVLVYWIERIHRETNMEKITLFFDMDGTGLSNMDLEFIKMVIETFKQYYPNALNYILVFEMAWVLNAAFKIVKALLPEKAVEILKIITKKTISTYVDKDNCLVSWGGTDSYEFSYVPEVRKAATNVTATAPPSAADDQNNNVQDKKVHFANSSPTRVPAAEQQTQMHDIPEKYSPQDHEMLRVSPQDFLFFNRNDAKDCVLELTCMNQTPVTFKIQTTSPEKFRVRPRCGILNPGESLSVNILLKAEHVLSDNGKDKFLIMCLPALDLQMNQVADFWKRNGQQTSSMEQHRLCCSYKDMVSGCGTAFSTQKQQGDVCTGDPAVCASKKLERQLRFTQVMQIVTLIFILILSAAVIYLLKLQIGPDDSCMSNESSSQSVDCSSCSQGRADL